MVYGLESELLATASRVAVVATLALTLWALVRFHDGSIFERLRRRFVFGIPWGTVLVVGFVVAIYLFVQGGWNHPRNPVVYPFVSWSYFYPLGMIASPFTHANLGHVTGNMLGTLVFAPIVEYAWGHYPRERGRQTFTDFWTNPFDRILAFFLAVIAVGVGSSYLVPGPVIGFSGVLFTFAGFALIRYPIAAIGALLLNRIVSLVYYSLQNPVSIARAGTEYSQPWWANVALHGHGFGLLAGLLIGLVFVHRRDDWPDPVHVLFGVLAYAAFQAMWAVNTAIADGAWILLRGIGTAAILLLALLAGAAAARSNRPLVPHIDLSRREAAVGLLLATLLAISLVAVPVNMLQINPDQTDDAVQVEDYSVTYVENAQNEYASGVPLPVIKELGWSSNTSGVIVISERRQLWSQAYSPEALAERGEAEVLLGGVGWRETVTVNRTGWDAVDGNSTFRVAIAREGDSPRTVYTADPAEVGPILGGRNMTIAPSPAGYDLVISRNNNTVDRGPLPSANQSVTLGGIHFELVEGDLYAEYADTRLRVASRS